MDGEGVGAGVSNTGDGVPAIDGEGVANTGAGVPIGVPDDGIGVKTTGVGAGVPDATGAGVVITSPSPKLMSRRYSWNAAAETDQSDPEKSKQ